MDFSKQELKCLNRLLGQDINEVTHDLLHGGESQELQEYKQFLGKLQAKIKKGIKQ